MLDYTFYYKSKYSPQKKKKNFQNSRHILQTCVEILNEKKNDNETPTMKC